MLTEKPIAMNYYSSYMSDEKSPDSIPRVCNIRMTKLRILSSSFKNIPKKVVLSLSIKESRRLLRSSIIELTEDGEFLTADIDFSFTLKYLHFFRTKYNILSVCLQKNRIYNNKIVSGYKTLAAAMVDLNWIIQKQHKETIKLTGKSKDFPAAIIYLSTFNSVPAGKECESLNKSIGDNVPVEINTSSMDSDNDNIASYNLTKKHNHRNKTNSKLLKVLGSLKINDELRENILELADKGSKEKNFEDCMFESSTSDDNENSYPSQTSYTPNIQPHFQDSMSEDSIISSLGSNPRDIKNMSEEEFIDYTPKRHASLQDPVDQSQLESAIPSLPVYSIKSDTCVNENYFSAQNEDIIACFSRSSGDYYYLILTMEDPADNLIRSLRSGFRNKLIIARDQHEVNQVLNTIFSCIQNLINTLKTIPFVKICVFGQDESLTCFLRELIQLNIPRLNEILENFQILFAPKSLNTFSKYLCQINSIYGSIFNTEAWGHILSNSTEDVQTLISYIFKYINSQTKSMKIPISEVCLKTHAAHTEQAALTQIVVPFFMYVNIGYINVDIINCEKLTNIQSFFKLGNKPQPIIAKQDKGSSDHRKSLMKGLLHTRQSTYIEDPTILIDYWVISSQSSIKESDKITKSDKKEKKIINKGEYQLVTIYRNNFMHDSKKNSLTSENLNLIISKSHLTEQSLKPILNKDKQINTYIKDITHVVCTSKSSNFTVDIDGHLWDSVKYFTVSPQSSSNIKYFPLGLPNTYEKQ